MEREKSIYLRDIFGSQYSFADDPDRQGSKSGSTDGGPSAAASVASSSIKSTGKASEISPTTAKEAPPKIRRKKAPAAAAAADVEATARRSSTKSKSSAKSAENSSSLLRQRKASSSEERRKSSTRRSRTKDKEEKVFKSSALDMPSSGIYAPSTTAAATNKVDSKEIVFDPSLPAGKDLEEAANGAFSGSFFQDEYSSHSNDIEENTDAPLSASLKNHQNIRKLLFVRTAAHMT